MMSVRFWKPGLDRRATRGRGLTRALPVLLVAAACLQAAACAPQPAAPRADAPGRPGRIAETPGSAIPDAWAFPADGVAASRGVGGMVSTTDRVASEIGVEILRRGGNAVDAAVAVAFALAVVNPEAGNLGGGGFLIVHTAAGETAALDFRETAPRAATPDMFLDESGQPTDRSRVGHLAAGVPGSVAGMWAVHQRFGSLPWADLVEPAVNLAEGIVVHERLARSLADHEQSLRRYPATARALLGDERVPRVGDRLRQPDLVTTLRRIAGQGPDGFYRGRTAELIAAEMERGGGLMTVEDLDGYQAVWREPIAFEYRDHTIISMPPPSSGGVALAELLNILEGYDVGALAFLSVDHVHLWAEAAKRAFVDRNRYLADPDFVVPPIRTLVSDAYAAVRRAEIDAGRAAPAAEVDPGLESLSDSTGPGESAREGGETTHYSVVDGRGNAVSVTTTLNSLYGSLVTVAGAGFLLNNEMDDFATSPGRPNQYGLVESSLNAVAPGKRMLSSMSPTIVLAPDGHVRLVTGSPGGPMIISSVAQLVSDVVDFDMGLGPATAAPRVHHQHVPDVLYYERDGLSAEVVSALRFRGHVVEERSGYQGDLQSILVSPDGTLTGAADPRRGGAAIALTSARNVVQ